MFIPTRMKLTLNHLVFGEQSFNSFIYKNNSRYYLVGMEKFDEGKELGYIAKWVAIIGGIMGIGKYLGFDIPSIILVALLLFVFVQYNIKTKESDHYKEQAEKYEELYNKTKNGKKKK